MCLRYEWNAALPACLCPIAAATVSISRGDTFLLAACSCDAEYIVAHATFIEFYGIAIAVAKEQNKKNNIFKESEWKFKQKKKRK